MQKSGLITTYLKRLNMIDIILIILVILTVLLNIMYLKNKKFEKRFDAILIKIANKIFNL